MESAATRDSEIALEESRPSEETKVLQCSSYMHDIMLLRPCYCCM